MIGYLWSIEVKNDIKALPSINEIMYGLYLFVAQQLENKLRFNHQKQIWIDACQNCYKKLFDYILELVDYQNPNEPLTVYELTNPNSKATCLVLYMYSMESPFSVELNNSWKSLDQSKVATFGPIERALCEILRGAEANRRDRLESCSVVSCSQSFLLYKGAAMTKE